MLHVCDEVFEGDVWLSAPSFQVAKIFSFFIVIKCIAQHLIHDLRD
jgi:hypothetical protein